MSEQIKPCPFCSSEDVEVFSNYGRYFVTCCDCGSEGPNKEGKEEAIKGWNQRPYDYDMPAIVKKVQRLEAAINQAITDCIPLLSWIDDDDTAVEMVEHLSEILGGALCKQPE
jgi:Lar family restriction alleviation protein